VVRARQKRLTHEEVSGSEDEEADKDGCNCSNTNEVSEEVTDLLVALYLAKSTGVCLSELCLLTPSHTVWCGVTGHKIFQSFQ